MKYSTFADAVGLIIPDVSVRARAAAKDSAIRGRVGLYVGDRWVRRPLRNGLPAVRRLLTSEKIFAALIETENLDPESFR